MQSNISKPILVYDNECDFCRYWITQWQHITQDRIDYAPYQEVAPQFNEIPLSAFQSSVQLILEDGQVFSGAEAVLRALNNRIFLWGYYKLPLFAPLSEAVYRFVAHHRQFFSVMTRWFYGTHTERTTFFLSRWLFHRGLGCIYLIAFLSLWVQIHGLIGSNGILPISEYLAAVHQQIGIKGYHLVPTIFWFNSSDLFLHIICAVGVTLSVVLITGFFPTVSLIGLWCLYLSLITVGRVFLSFQWDVLLLEVGLLAIFFAPLIIRDTLVGVRKLSTPFLWLLRWLLFRLMFASGFVKLASDELWRDLTALNFHYETQPLPTWIGWYVHQLPEWFHKLSVLGMFVVELGVPFLIFAPRRVRTLGCIGLVALQILIILTGNYCFFNLLTIILCLLLIDDVTWKSIIPNNFIPRINTFDFQLHRISKICIVALSIMLFIFSSLRFGEQLFGKTKLAELAWIRPYRSVNTYGLFANMTESRPEIVIEGSNDQITWEPYEFKWKPGELNRAPGWVAPHQPRLDWQMWFAALRGNYRNTSWFLDFIGSLLQGKPEVLKLLKENPFPDSPPRYVKATLYEYRFTDIDTKRTEGKWWHRERIGIYCPTISLR
ncbi:MAG: lipase maturation factor family protein [Candidatus Poribacteria bacterium]|nr:lipase maturation factor family protein [Candidatus Poribacteria bacterium]